ncbi:WD repeat-containing protein 76 isoform X2 [Ambystoma mexicanum]|uniref:WD repeat-containing protein 76 isoform X2 n=1 Tax=Ambystoma mexicanum TaxID=8296 RepID=UPI0037E872B3
MAGVMVERLPLAEQEKLSPAGLQRFQKTPAPLSEYEMKRLQNIQDNAKFFAALNLLETASALKKKTKTHTPSRGLKRTVPKVQEVEGVRRRSMRLQRVDPSGTPLPEAPVQWDPLSGDDNPMKPAGPLDMTPVDEAEILGFLKVWKEASLDGPAEALKQPLSNLKGYKSRLRSMTLGEEQVAKVTKNRIFSVAIHPSESRTLVAAGDKWGQVGLWNLDDRSSDDGVYVFEPHSRPVGCLHFSPAHPAHLLSVSYDGTLRCGDVSKAVFDEVYRDESASFSSFDFLSNDCSTLIVGHWDADIAVVDRRTPGTSHELLGQVNSKTVRTVHMHPVDLNYFLTAGAGDVSIYDLRRMKPRGMRPVASLSGNTKSVGSAYFSPVTGNRVVTICADDRIRVYDTSSLHAESPPILLSLKHNNNTGRWLTRFRPVWDYKQEDCFVVGSMARPRQIEIFHESGELVHAFTNEDYLGSVCSINALHPTRNLLVGGNSSGRLHVFMD